MNGTYTLNDLAMMTGFTTRTLRNYLSQGLLKGEKTGGAWQFTAEEIERFFEEPFVKEGVRIKRSGVIFDFLSGGSRKEPRTCVILDAPATRQKGARISSFFCEQMKAVSDLTFTFDWNHDHCRVILCGAAAPAAQLLAAYHAASFDD